MPITSPFDALKSTRPQGPQVPGVVQDAAAEAQQQSQPEAPWYAKAFDSGLSGLVGGVKGVLGMDDGSQGMSANHIAQLGMAALPMLSGLSGGVLGGLKAAAPAAEAAEAAAAPRMFGQQAAQAASQSAADLFNPAAARQMQGMYEQANPAFKGLESSGMFGGDRSVGGLHQVGPGIMSGRPDLAAVGEEGLFNAGRPSAPPAQRPDAASPARYQFGTATEPRFADALEWARSGAQGPRPLPEGMELATLNPSTRKPR